MDRCFYIPFPEVSAVTFSFSCISNESLPVISMTLACFQSVVTPHVCAVTWTGESSSLSRKEQVSCDEFSLGIRLTLTHRAANMGLQVLEALLAPLFQ